MTQVTTLIFVCAWTFWNVLYPIKEYYESMAHAKDRPDLRNKSNEQMSSPDTKAFKMAQKAREEMEKAN